MPYTYDFKGDRISVDDGSTVVYYPKRYYSIDSNGVQDKYIYNGDVQVGMRVTVGTSTQNYVFHDDHLNGTTLVTDTNGNPVQEVDYYPYGSLRVNDASTTFDSEKKYIGGDYDQTTALSYLNARYYDGQRGQFASEDPIFWSPNLNLWDPQSLNSYSYGQDNPLSNSDPAGLISEDLVDSARRAVLQQQINDLKTQVEQLWRNITITAPEAFVSGAFDTVGASKTILDPSVPTYIKVSSGIGIVGSLLVPEDKIIDGTKLLLNPEIKITSSALRHVTERHTVTGLKNVNASLFNPGENITNLIRQGTQQAISTQENGNFQRIFDLGRNIGTDRVTKEQTSVMTIITNAEHNLVTAFPGVPSI